MLAPSGVELSYISRNETMCCIVKRGYLVMGIVQTKKWLASSLKAILNENGVLMETYIKNITQIH